MPVAGGNTGIPSNATAVVLNVTATNNSAPGFASVFPAGTASQPLVSNLNWAAGQTIANLVVVPVGSNGQVTLFRSTHADVIADLQGFFGGSSNSAGGYVAMTPSRISDSRAASGLPNAGQTLGAGSTLSVQVGGAGGVPSGATAAILNVTVTNTSAASYLTAYPAGAGQPTASNLNWTAGQTLANRVIAPLGTGGKVNLFNAAGNADVVVDVSGYYSSTSGSGYMPLSPVRIADSRASASTLGAGGTMTVQVAGVGGTANNAKAAILNVTATDTTAAGYLTVYPGGTRPLASDLNFRAGQTVPNLVVATLSSTGTISIYNPAGSTDVVVDLFGFFAPSAGVNVTADPTSIPADGASTSAITATATNSSGGPIFSDPISLTMSGSPSGACGSLDNASGMTDANGQFMATYTSSQTPGSCTITATEATKGLSGSTSITQTLAPYSINVQLRPDPLRADGVSSAAVQAFVRDVSGQAVVGDAVSFSLAGHPSSASCGTLTAGSATTDVDGFVQVTYVASTNAGFCVVTGTEAITGSSSKTTPFGSTMDQTTNGPQVNNISSNPSFDTLKADGKATDTILATVTNAGSGGAILGDEVMFSLSPGAESPAAACGTVSPAFGATDASGQVSATYTASTTAGSCDITILEANGHSWTFSHINQRQVLNSMSLSANPSSIPADSVSTSTITATITDVTGAAVQGDTVQFNAFGGFGCGLVSPGSSTTDASGKATTTYTAGIFIGFCPVQAADLGPSPGSGASKSILITQTLPRPSIAVSASPSSLPANNASHSTVTATVSSANGGTVAGDPIHLTSSGSPAGACGNLGPTFGATNGSGEFVANYKSTFTPGTCTITATEAIAGLSATTTITQTQVPNTVSLSLSSSSLPADGASTAGIGAHVTDVMGAAVANDKVTFTLTGSPAAACGTLSSASSTTDAGGNAGVTYTASLTTGFCKVGASEAKTGGSASAALLDQTTNPAESNHVSIFTNGGSIPANGKASEPVTIRVVDNAFNRPVQGDPVMFTLNGDACGTVSPALGFTDSTGLLSTTYTASTTAGPCDLVATEGNGAASNNAMLAQSQVANSVGVVANPSSVKGDGVSTSTVTATITDVSGAPVAGDNVGWSVTGPAGCGTLSNLGSSITDANGHAAATYTAGTAIAFCTVTAEDLGPSPGSDASFGPGGVTGSTQIDQLGPTFSRASR